MGEGSCYTAQSSGLECKIEFDVFIDKFFFFFKKQCPDDFYFLLLSLLFFSPVPAVQISNTVSIPNTVQTQYSKLEFVFRVIIPLILPLHYY